MGKTNMTKLPERNLLDGTKNPETTTGEFRLAMGNLRQFLFELFGNESSDKQTARETLGIDLIEINGNIATKADKQTVETAFKEKADISELSGVAFTGDYRDLINAPEKSDTLQGYGILVDNTPSEGSTRPVTSEGIKNYVDNKIASQQHGIKLLTSTGTFTVPNGVNSIFVQLCGGGGSGQAIVSRDAAYGTGGGTSSFGSYITANGGGGGCAWGDSGGGGWAGAGGTASGPTNAIVFDGLTGTSSGTEPHITIGGKKYGHGGAVQYGGGGGGFVMGWISNLTPGEVINVTIGNAGSAAAGAGACLVSW